MIALIVLVVLLLVAAGTDIARHQIYNWNTYSGILLGLLLNALGFGVLGGSWEGLVASLQGFLACGAIMLAAFVFFEMGGGDVKLIAMIGAFLGVDRGIESLLWTFSIGFVCGVSMLIWQQGALKLLGKAIQHLRVVLSARSWVPLTPSERKPLQRGLFLAPSAFAAVIIVLLH